MTTQVPLEVTLRTARDGGRKLLAPYVTAGLDTPTCSWLDLARAVVDAGADAMEVGIPFSDPVMDGPTIQQASQRALDCGATPAKVLAELADADLGIPIIAMTYGNIVFSPGWQRFADDLARAGAAGAIVPDLPLEESAPWEAAATSAGIATVLLAAPITPDERLVRICQRSRGFVYGVTTMGVTGERAEMAASAATLARRIKATTDLPVMMGFGISTPAHAVEMAAAADGVIVGAALLRQVLDGASASQAAQLIGQMRAALDAG